jgi:outer membrane protein assembly factor BamB
MADLELHLLCVDRNSGNTRWDRAVQARMPETEYGGMMLQHGYASHTPVTDGKTVYAFFGKSGVHAFDLDGMPLWQAEVGDGLDDRKWGSSASPILVGDILVVTASAESKAIYGFDKKSGEQRWKYDTGDLAHIWATPILVGEDVVLNAPNRIVAVNARTGKETWSVQGLKTDAITGSLVAGGGKLFAMGARGAGSLALRANGNMGSVEWTGRDGANILSPVYHEDHLYWVDGSLAECRNATTGEEVYSERLPEAPSPPASSTGEGGRDARFAGMDYASPVAANGLMYQTRRKGEVLVIKLQPEFELVSRNQFKSDTSDFIATPAVSDGQLFLRSMKALYCVAQ